MSPKEKAQELVLLFLRIKNTDVDGWAGMNTHMAKQCALIMVDQLEKQEAILSGYNPTWYSSEYWQEVKQEIEKL